ncbi:MAG: sensor domain-containing diguanylate cyclase [candidate division KSB1 bacterium]|nr:sensor domain-containing diguanylate cyclase [candidate division KSB1 bacterium]MDZ7273221.1 sensor domain-containing diguanylate cyclase [candidate division KSB1 bacterium]MDZ7285323.1 sensor domain-containing diguanylate cyclase [candidate division KSB1 bacterium]MDZ7298355.1 sensor domain-containing diguanylate cyclase [candidate division KSB1 bacterium]MDZ7308519.1 sensor domain-containing diguanylate cyclase [candidate division KSB1 bacterium]
MAKISKPSSVDRKPDGVSPARRGSPGGRDSLFLEYYCLYRIAATLTEETDVDRTAREVKRIVRESFPAQQFCLALLDRKQQELYIKSHFGFTRAQAQTAHFPLQRDNIFGLVMHRRRLIHLPDLNTAAAIDYHPGHRHRRGAFLALPLLGTTHQPLGVLSLYRSKPASFATREIELLQKIANQTGQVIEKIHVYHETRELSITDELTGAFNRRYFNQRYETEFMRALRYNRPLSVIMLDIDHFKKFNDTHGHLLGDKVLKMVAQVLEGSLRKADLLARYGGEEFVIVLPEINKEKGRKVAEKLRRAIERTIFPKAETQPLGQITISLGLASFPEDTEEGHVLLALADEALYQAKFLGRNQVGVTSGQATKMRASPPAVRSFATPQ